MRYSRLIRVIITVATFVTGLAKAAENQTCISDEFLSGTGTSGAIGSLGWSSSSLGVSPNRGEQDHPGNILFGGFAGLADIHLFSQETPGPFNSDMSFDLTWIVRRTTASFADSHRVGLIDDVRADPPVNGIYFEAANTGRWVAVVRSAGASISAVVQDPISTSDSWRRLRARRVVRGVEFYVDGQFVALLESRYLPAPTTALNVGMQVKGNANVAADYFSICLFDLRR